MSASVQELSVPVQPPYRLDLTATVLRRLSTNVVDIFEGGVYRRLVGNPAQPALLAVTQVGPELLAVRVEGDARLDVAGLVRRLLGTEVDLTYFYAAAADFAWLARIVAAARGVKSPRYPSLWEAIVNAVVYQQISIHAAGAILRRIIERYAPLRTLDGTVLAAFVEPQTIVNADALELRALGLSTNKIVALRTLGRAILDGELAENELEPLSTPDLVVRLATFKGIGPWTAAVIALRGFGRLDIFPLKDSGVARGLKDLSADPDVDGDAILARLGPQRGMLYYHLLLGRLATRGDIELDG